MKTITRTRRTAALLLTGALAAVPALALSTADATAGTSRQAAHHGDRVAAIRAATAKYHDIDVALADGYVPVSECVESPEGAMGVHYMNPALAGAPVDLRHPAFLLYLPGRDGMRLVGVEYFKADADQDLATDEDRPSLLGHEFDGPMPGHGPGAPVHYDLHVWTWAHNPDGMFAEFNPALSC
ncbi:hypothetical protein ACFFOS_09845 [Nocardioides kongjuensis]|uniref:Uncharacterized protein n=1 Tax=Nocardioides kongjuensis TaxID=349522 RepID=A0A852RRR0_9ACTN|nr:hypothetical protein [Nocardioides kongjuensis]NYD30624.1 hypothetical protein [Nocardioides kongjuensis]